MNYDDRPGDRPARRDRKKDNARKARLEETKAKELARLQLEEAAVETRASKKRKLAKGAQTGGSAGLPVPTPVQLLGKPVKNRREMWDCLQKLSWKKGNVKTTTFGRGSITLGVTRGAPGADGFDQEGYNDQAVHGCLSKNDQEQCVKLWELLRDEGRALGFEFSSAQLNRNFRALHSHHHRRTDKDHQWCLSLGGFTGGEDPAHV